METKPISQSRTFWFNVFCAAFTALIDHVDLLRSYLSDGGFLVLMMLISAGNVYLRSITGQPVTWK